MISREEFNKIQFLLGSKSNPRPKSKTFAFTGLIRCGECGAAITAEDKYKKQKNGNVHHYTYYHCTKRVDPNCTQKVVELKNLETQILEILSNITIPREFTEWAIDILVKENEGEAKVIDNIAKTYQKNLNSCTKEIYELLNLKLKSLITDEEYIIKKKELEEEKFKYNNLLKNNDSRNNEWITNIEKLFNFAETAKDRFEKGTLSDKKEILYLTGSNLSLKDGKLHISLKKPMIYINEISKEVKKVNLDNTNVRTYVDDYKKRTYRESFSASPLLLREQDSNLQPFG